MSHQAAIPVPASTRHARLTMLAALVAAAALAAGAWLVVVRPGSSESGAGAGTANAANAHLATVGGLRATAHALGHAIYWLGPRQQARYELTVTNARLVYVRYLPAGAAVGDRKPNYITVGTYPKPGAYGILSAARKLSGSRVQELGSGAIAVTYKTRPKSVYVAYRRSPLMIEVYAPAVRGAETIVRDGLLVPLR